MSKRFRTSLHYWLTKLGEVLNCKWSIKIHYYYLHWLNILNVTQSHFFLSWSFFTSFFFTLTLKYVFMYFHNRERGVGRERVSRLPNAVSQLALNPLIGRNGMVHACGPLNAANPAWSPGTLKSVHSWAMSLKLIDAQISQKNMHK